MSAKRSGWGGVITASLIVIKKWAVLGKAIKAVKLLKVAKPLVMVMSILVSVLAYGWMYGSWWFAGGLVVMIFIHEMGHVIAMRREGLPPSPMVFIPFLGAAIFVPEMRTRRVEAIVGIGGPLLGTAGAIAAFALWYMLPERHDILLLVSYVGLVLNLFNMIPISPLDGGRITQICGSWFKYLGLALVVALLGYTKQPALLLIVVLVLDAFNNLPRWWRPFIAWSLTITMIVLFYSGHGEQHWIVDIIDSIFAVFFSLAFTLFDIANERDRARRYDDDTVITVRDRMRWFALWAILVAFLCGMLAVQMPLMPKQVLHNARTLAE